MLTHTERVRSNLHKHLKRCSSYTKIEANNVIIPETLISQEVLGTYTNRDDSKIFFTYGGLFLYPSKVFIPYFHIQRTKVDLSTATKHDVEVIQIYFVDGQQKDLPVKQPIREGVKTNELWSIFSFLRGATSKMPNKKSRVSNHTHPA